jgi:serine/threonine protein kinase
MIPIPDDQAFQEAENEAKLLQASQNKHIVKYFDSFRQPHFFYLLTQFYEHGNLRSKIDEHISNGNVKMEAYDIIHWSIQILKALEFLHNNPEKKLIHRDLKPV